MNIEITTEALERMKHKYLEELCGDCSKRSYGSWCPMEERVMPDYVPACPKWGDPDE